MSTIYVLKEEADALRLENTTGVAIIQNQFLVMTGKCLKACEAVGIAAIGGFDNLLGRIVEAADFVTGENIFATSNLAIYWNPVDGKFSHLLTTGYYRVGYTIAPIASGVIRFVGIDPVLMPADIATLEAVVEGITELAGRPFRKTVTLTAAAAGTAVPIVAASEVTGSNKVFITDVLINVGGGTAWTDSTGTVITIQDTAASPVVAVTAAKAQLTANAILGKHSVGITLAAPIITGVGLTAAKGLSVIADSNFDAGSDLYVTVVGFIAEA